MLHIIQEALPAFSLKILDWRFRISDKNCTVTVTFMTAAVNETLP